MTSEEIAQVVENGETMYAESSRSRRVRRAWLRAFISFLNTEGGVLWLGIEDYGTVKGVADVDAARQRVNQILANKVTPRATAFVEQVEVGEKLLLKIAVPRGVDRPYYTQRGSVLCAPERRGASSIARRDSPYVMAVRAFYYDETALTGTGLTEVELAVFDAFLTAAYGLTEDTDRPDEELARLLRNLKCMAGDELTVAGALLFGHQPQRMLPTAACGNSLTLQETAAGETILDRKTIDGRLPQQLEQVESLLRLHLRNAGVIRGFEPEVQTELPLEMLREALTNALCPPGLFAVRASARLPV